jgi:hypothetical protein
VAEQTSEPRDGVESEQGGGIGGSEATHGVLLPVRGARQPPGERTSSGHAPGLSVLPSRLCVPLLELHRTDPPLRPPDARVRGVPLVRVPPLRSVQVGLSATRMTVVVEGSGRRKELIAWLTHQQG